MVRNVRQCCGTRCTATINTQYQRRRVLPWRDTYVAINASAFRSDMHPLLYGCLIHRDESVVPGIRADVKSFLMKSTAPPAAAYFRPQSMTASPIDTADDAW